MIVGIHRIALRQGIAAEDFESFMANDVFPAAAETPGSVNRGGQSSIKSQHLLRADGEYLWLVKGSGAFDEPLFAGVFARMFDEVRERLERFGRRESSTLFTVIDSLDVGPRDELGRPTGDPLRGDDL